MEIKTLINSSFDDRLEWTMEDLELAEMESEKGFHSGSLIDIFHLENEVWRSVKADYPDVEILSLNVKYLDTLSEEDKEEYMNLREY